VRVLDSFRGAGWPVEKGVKYLTTQCSQPSSPSVFG